MMKFARILSILTFIVQFSAYSQEIKFRHLTGNDGLLSNSVKTILQDSDGFMWIGTIDGLCKYDGYSFTNFIYSPNDSLTLSNNFVSCLAEDEKNNLWIGTRNGLNRLNRETYKIERFTSILNDSIEMGSILSLLVCDSSMLWIGTDNTGLYCMDLNNYQLTNYRHATNNSNSIINDGVNCMLNDKKRGLLIGTKDGLEIFDQTTSTFKQFLPGLDIRCLNLYKDGSVFIGAISDQNAYYKMTGDSLIETVLLPEPFMNKEVLSHNDSDGNQWISIREKGILYYDNTKITRCKLSYDKYDADGISSNAIMCFCEDKFGNIWIGTFDSGIDIYKKNDNAFIHIKDNYLPSGMQNNRVRSIYQDSEEDIWIGTKVGGALSKFNRQTLTFTHYRHDPSDPFSISSDFIFCITEDRPGYLWVGTSHGLNLFEKKTGKSISFFPDPEKPNSINSGEIYALFKDDENLYVGTGAGGLNVLNTEQNTVAHYTHTSDSNSISSNNIWVINKDSRDNIWIGSENGLNLFHRETGTFTRFQNDPVDSQSISNNDIKCIYEDNDRNLWIGTIYGLNLMDSLNNTFTVFTTNDGLPGNYISSIQGDSLGYLWISTKKGLSRFNTETSTFRNYTVIDGLQDNEFSPNVHCQTKNGEMLFGGNNGFNIFHPNNISTNLVVPDILLTDFKLFNQRVPINVPNSPLKKHISRCDEITLKHEQSVITIDYVAINYTSPEKNQYAYIMEGFEKQWNYVGNKREATYTNLDPGTYIFRVKASNDDGLWNEEGVSLIINILPPPWRTWWAYLIYSMLLLSILLVIRYYSIKRIHEEKGRELDQQNLQFFINVSHEFRTPLTLILNPIKRILSSNNLEESKEAARDINLSANKLMNLVNQLLDFRKTDLGQLPLIAVKTDIVKYSHEIFDLFKGIGESKDINFIFKSSNSEIQAWFDPDKYEKILNNLLSNAVKFTDNGGQIVLSISKRSYSDEKNIINQRRKDQAKKYVEIKVQDTGIGLNKEQIKHIFERFYSSDASKTGTGIGLNYSKSLVELHGGRIEVESPPDNYREGKGSTFTVLLPLGNKHLKENQISKFDFNLGDYKFKLNQLESLEFDIAATDDFSEYKNIEEEDIPVNPEGKLPVVLIVEDNKKLRNQLKDALKNNYNIKEAINGKDGLEKVEKYYPDLIISDVMMPIMDGIDLCHQIKTNIDTCHIPIVLLTAKNLVENKIEGFKTGADEYISKPFIISVLKARIENLLESRKRLKKKYKSTSVLVPAKDVTNNNLDEQFLEKLTQIVLENIMDCNFSPSDLEKAIGVSRTKLYLKINSLTGNGTGSFIRDIKLKYAVELILQKKYRINEISFMAGFKSHAYFTKVFRDKFDTTPLQYQKNNT